MHQPRVSVVDLYAAGEDALVEAQQSVNDQLEAGKDVVVFCDRGMPNREERLLLARPALARRRGKLAIVHPDFSDSTNALPQSILSFVRCFDEMESAMNWLRPQSASSTQTLLYMKIH